jgi:hypothetical protein
MEAKGLLNILEKQLPALSALDEGLGALAPLLRSAGQVLRKAEAQPDSPGAWAGELEGVLRSLRAAVSQLRAQGASGHSATVLKALIRIDALLTPFTRSAEPSGPPSRPRAPSVTGMPAVSPSSSPPSSPRPPSQRVPVVARRPSSTRMPVVAPAVVPEPPADAPAEAPRKLAEPPLAFARPSAAAPPAPRHEELEPYDTLEDAPASGAAAMRWSVGTLALAPMERPPLPSREPPAVEHEASEEEPPEPPAPPEEPLPSAGLGPESPRAGRARFSEELLALQLEHLSSAFNSRMALLSSGEATGSMLARLEGGFLAHADALRWMGADALHALAERLESAEDAGFAFATALPLLSVEGNDTVEAVQRAAQSAAPELAAGLVEALRFAPHPRVPAVLEALSGSEAPAFLRAPALGLLVQAGRWEASRVHAALSSDEPDLVAAAARAVLTAGRGEHLGALEALMTHELEAPADVEVLVAASVLGSSAALGRARARLAQEAAPPAALIRLIAACGAPEDSQLLWRLGQKKGPVAREALWALARLGVASALPRLRELAEEEATAEVASEALRFLVGTGGQAPATGRVAQGAAWAAQVPLSVLMSPVTPSAERQWAFWELAARTGLHVAIDVHWPWRRQLQAARAWEVAVRGMPHRLAGGNWLYRGKLFAKGDGT